MKFDSGARQGGATDWRSACEYHAKKVLQLSMHVAEPRFDCQEEMLVRIDNFGHWVEKGWEPNPATFKMIGANAWAELERESEQNWGVGRVTELLCSKQHDYGHGNISKFGTVGLMVRMSDKAERLRNLRGKTTSPQNESLVDTLLDILGYSVLALMWIDGTFMLELAETPVEATPAEKEYGIFTPRTFTTAELALIREATASTRLDDCTQSIGPSVIVRDPNQQQLDEFFAAPAVHVGDADWRVQLQLPDELQWKEKP